MLQAVGRTPSGKKISAEKAGVAVTARGFIDVKLDLPRFHGHVWLSRLQVGMIDPT